MVAIINLKNTRWFPVIKTEINEPLFSIKPFLFVYVFLTSSQSVECLSVLL